MLIFACCPCPYLSQTGEQYIDSQSPDGCSLHQIVFTVGQPQQHSDAHQLGLVLKSNSTHTASMKFSISCIETEAELSHCETHRQLCKGLGQDGGECVASTGLQHGMLFVLQRSVQWTAQDFWPKLHHLYHAHVCMKWMKIEYHCLLNFKTGIQNFLITQLKY